MTANTTEIFQASVNNWNAELTTANANRDGSGTLATLVSSGANTNGARIDRVLIKAEGTTHTGVVRFYLNAVLVLEVPVVAQTPDAAGVTFSRELVGDGRDPLFVLTAGVALKASTHIGDHFQVHAFGGLY